MAYVSDLPSKTHSDCRELFQKGETTIEAVKALMVEAKKIRDLNWNFKDNKDMDSVTFDSVREVFMERWVKSNSDSSIMFNKKTRMLIIENFVVAGGEVDKMTEARHCKTYRDKNLTPWDAARGIAHKNNLKLKKAKQDEEIPF